MDKKKVIAIAFLIILAVVIGVGIFFAIRGAWELRVIDHNLQMAEFGFVKDDITMLSIEQVATRNWLATAIIVGFIVEFGIVFMAVCVAQDLAEYPKLS